MILNVICDNPILFRLQIILQWCFVKTDTRSNVEEMHVSLVNHHNEFLIGNERSTLKEIPGLGKCIIFIFHQRNLFYKLELIVSLAYVIDFENKLELKLVFTIFLAVSLRCHLISGGSWLNLDCSSSWSPK